MIFRSVVIRFQSITFGSRHRDEGNVKERRRKSEKWLAEKTVDGVCVCVCVSEREREREREKKNE